MADLSKDTLLFAAEKRRMCKAFPECSNGCPLKGKACHVGWYGGDAATDAQILSTLQKWHEEHPFKTYAQDFFEKFPNVRRDTDGTPFVCRMYLYNKGEKCPKQDVEITCFQCWNEPMTEDNL
ncbi:MAG: hypothetical protein Q4F79_01925 [Eubacteriales bacterium]|nr:hypothetical protein [Eubacteriales bacterium]